MPHFINTCTLHVNLNEGGLTAMSWLGLKLVIKQVQALCKASVWVFGNLHLGYDDNGNMSDWRASCPCLASTQVSSLLCRVLSGRHTALRQTVDDTLSPCEEFSLCHI